MRTKEYLDFSMQLHEKGARRPIVGQFELTHRCNLRCRHCYIVRDATRAELTYEEICRILDELHKEGCLWLCLTGGEPLMREDFLDIYSYARQKGFIITVFTNGTLLDEKTATYLSSHPPFCVEMTLNGATKNTYELITQVEDSFEKAMHGIELIRKHKLPFKIKCQAITLNVHELPLIQKFCQEIGAEFRCSTLIDPRMNGSVEPCSLRLPVNQIAGLRERHEAFNERDEVEDNLLRKKVNSDALFRCPGGTWSFYVNPYGELFFCNSMRKPSLQLRNESFREGFYRFFSRIRSQKFKTDSPCRKCNVRSVCLWCPGKAYLETGNMEAPIPYYCDLAQLSRSVSAG
jgi:radical SAM protein with 4Fe4S-binding SPASM domain